MPAEFMNFLSFFVTLSSQTHLAMALAGGSRARAVRALTATTVISKVAAAVVSPIAGRLSDLVGRKPVLLDEGGAVITPDLPRCFT
jgi:MFS family permease